MARLAAKSPSSKTPVPLLQDQAAMNRIRLRYDWSIASWRCASWEDVLLVQNYQHQRYKLH